MRWLADRYGGQIKRFMRGFAVLHMSQMLLNIAYTFAQTLVFARTLTPSHYAEVIFLTAVGFYLQPLDQAIGRSAYVSFRSNEPGAREGSGVAIHFVKAQAVMLICLSVGIPCLMNSNNYLGNALYLLGCLYSNFWHYDLQPVLWAAGLERRFALLTILRRLYFFAALVTMWFTADFVLFGVLNTIGLAFSIWLAVRMFQRSDLIISGSGKTTRQNFLKQLSQLGTSFLSTMNELLILNSPYAVLTVIFGVGPALIIFDTMMKVVRLTMTGIRTFAEVFLRTISQDIVADKRSRARKKLLLLVLAALAASAFAAVVMLFTGPLVFRILLGPNNIMPWAATPATALIILMAGLYQPTIFFLSFLNATNAIYITSAAALVGVACYWAAIVGIGADETTALWLYGAFFTCITLLASILLARSRVWIANPANA
jgi:hypothetical protein